jgi:hypothetical protein
VFLVICFFYVFYWYVDFFGLLFVCVCWRLLDPVEKNAKIFHSLGVGGHTLVLSTFLWTNSYVDTSNVRMVSEYINIDVFLCVEGIELYM